MELSERKRYYRPYRGPLAHLVERFHGMEEVRGSIPLGSTAVRYTTCMEQHPHHKGSVVESITEWIGSMQSLIVHTVLFFGAFGLAIFSIVPWNTMLLVVTTLVSFEAIYLSIFIQMTVNRHAKELEEVSEDVEDIQEDIEEISEDVEDIQEDIDEITGEI